MREYVGMSGCVHAGAGPEPDWGLEDEEERMGPRERAVRAAEEFVPGEG